MRLSNFLCYSVAALSTMMLTTFLRCGLFILSTLFMTTIVGAESMTMLQKPSTPVFRTYKYPITSWVAPYAVAKTKAALESNDGAKANITHLGLQFWLPTTEGKAKLIEMDEVTEAAIIELRDWGHANGIRVMLCVFNHNGKEWDWPLAKAGFAEHKAEFVKSLVSEMERFGLDGIDIDLEGNGSFDTDREAFVAFMTDLSRELRARNKHLTVDTFCYIWNAPNQSWWPDLFPLVDSIASMAYDEAGATAPEWRAYDAQKKAAGRHTAKLQIGVLSGRDAWQGNTVLEQLQWIGKDGTIGLAIWDAQFRNPAWKTAELWQVLKPLR